MPLFIRVIVCFFSGLVTGLWGPRQKDNSIAICSWAIFPFFLFLFLKKKEGDVYNVRTLLLTGTYITYY